MNTNKKKEKTKRRAYQCPPPFIIEYLCRHINRAGYTGADPGFQVRRGGAHLKKLRRAEGGAKIFWVFRVKNHDLTPKNRII
jgi:hypothetical protein